MKKGKIKVIVAMLVGVSLLASGCGSSSSKSADRSAPAADYATATESYESGYMSDDIYYAEDAIEEEAGAGAESPQVQDSSRKLIKNVNLQVETETFDDLLSRVTEKTERLSGYIESSYTYNGSNYYGRGTRNASLTIRVPAEKLDEFMSAIAEVSNVISKNESVSDVTLQYVDMESHKKVLVAEQERLIELLEQAETIEDIITIESRLSEVRYQIESMESQLRTMDNQVSYSTVYLTIEEVEKLTPVKEQTIFDKISTGFSKSLYGVGSGLLSFIIWIIISIPYLVVWAIVIIVALLIVKAIRRRKQRKEAPEVKNKEAQNNEIKK